MSIEHVLVVDDSKSARLVLSKMLQNKNITVDTVESADQALAYLEEQNPDAIFMDHMMRGMDGLEATKRIKSNPATATVPIAIYTSHENEDYLAQVKAHGAVGLLLKPPTPEGLADILEALDAVSEGTIKASPIMDTDTQAPTQAPAQRIPPAANASATQAQAPAEATLTPAATPAPMPVPQRAPDLSTEQVEAIVRRIVERSITEVVEEELLPMVEKRLTDMRDDIIAINQTNIELSADTTIQKQVFPRVEEKVAELRRYVVSNGRTTAESVLNHALQHQVAPLLERKLAEFGKKLQDSNTKVIADITGKLFEANSKKIHTKISEDLNEKLVVLEAKLNEPSKIDPESFQELLEKSQTAATRKAKTAAEGTAESIASDVAQHIFNDIEERLKSVKIGAYVMASLAMIIGIGAALAVFFLK